MYRPTLHRMPKRGGDRLVRGRKMQLGENINFSGDVGGQKEVPLAWLNRVLPCTEPMKSKHWKQTFSRIFFLDDYGVFRPLDLERAKAGEMSHFDELSGLPYNVGEILHQFTSTSLTHIHHCATMGLYFKQLYRPKKLVDVLVHVEDQVFAAHRVALACHSLYFARIFMLNKDSDRKMVEIRLKNINKTSFFSVLRFIYTGKLYLNKRNVADMAHVANELQISAILFKCLDYLGRMPHDRAIDVVGEPKEQTIVDQARTILKTHLADLTHSANFFQMGIEAVELALSSDEVLVDQEMDVFNAAMAWLTYDLKVRRKYLERLMAQVRFVCMTPGEVIETSQVNGLIRSSPYCRNRVMEAVWLMTLKGFRTYDMLNCSCPKPRNCLLLMTPTQREWSDDDFEAEEPQEKVDDSSLGRSETQGQDWPELSYHANNSLGMDNNDLNTKTSLARIREESSPEWSNRSDVNIKQKSWESGPVGSDHYQYDEPAPPITEPELPNIRPTSPSTVSGLGHSLSQPELKANEHVSPDTSIVSLPAFKRTKVTNASKSSGPVALHSSPQLKESASSASVQGRPAAASGNVSPSPSISQTYSVHFPHDASQNPSVVVHFPQDASQIPSAVSNRTPSAMSFASVTPTRIASKSALRDPTKSQSRVRSVLTFQTPSATSLVETLPKFSHVKSAPLLRDSSATSVASRPLQSASGHLRATVSTLSSHRDRDSYVRHVRGVSFVSGAVPSATSSVGRIPSAVSRGAGPSLVSHGAPSMMSIGPNASFVSREVGPSLVSHGAPSMMSIGPNASFVSREVGPSLVSHGAPSMMSIGPNASFVSREVGRSLVSHGTPSTMSVGPNASFVSREVGPSLVSHGTPSMMSIGPNASFVSREVGPSLVSDGTQSTMPIGPNASFVSREVGPSLVSDGTQSTRSVGPNASFVSREVGPSLVSDGTQSTMPTGPNASFVSREVGPSLVSDGTQSTRSIGPNASFVSREVGPSLVSDGTQSTMPIGPNASFVSREVGPSLVSDGTQSTMPIGPNASFVSREVGPSLVSDGTQSTRSIGPNASFVSREVGPSLVSDGTQSTMPIGPNASFVSREVGPSLVSDGTQSTRSIGPNASFVSREVGPSLVSDGTQSTRPIGPNASFVSREVGPSLVSDGTQSTRSIGPNASFVSREVGPSLVSDGTQSTMPIGPNASFVSREVGPSLVSDGTQSTMSVGPNASFVSREVGPSLVSDGTQSTMPIGPNASFVSREVGPSLVSDGTQSTRSIGPNASFVSREVGPSLVSDGTQSTRSIGPNASYVSREVGPSLVSDGTQSTMPIGPNASFVSREVGPSLVSDGTQSTMSVGPNASFVSREVGPSLVSHGAPSTMSTGPSVSFVSREVGPSFVSLGIPSVTSMKSPSVTPRGVPSEASIRSSGKGDERPPTAPPPPPEPTEPVPYFKFYSTHFGANDIEGRVAGVEIDFRRDSNLYAAGDGRQMRGSGDDVDDDDDKDTSAATARDGLSPGNIVAVGGYIDDDSRTGSSHAQKLDGDGKKWEKFSDMPEARLNFGAACLNGKLYVIGGYDPSDMDSGVGATSDTFCFDPRKKRWELCGSMQDARSFLTVCVLGGCLYAVGGQGENEEVLKSAEVYDPGTKRWSSISPMASSRVGASSAVLDGQLVVAGGYGDSSDTPDDPCPVLFSTVRYDPASNSWQKCSNLRIPRAQASMVGIDRSLYLCGGVTRNLCTGVLCSVRDVDTYDPDTDQWTHVTDLQIARHNAGATVLGKEIYVVGGVSTDIDETLQSVECYNTVTSLWETSLPELPCGAKSLACTIIPAT